MTPVWMCGRGIRNSVVGILGCGNIGTSIAKKLKTFEISQLLYTSRTEKPAGKIVFNCVQKCKLYKNNKNFQFMIN